MRDDLEKLKAEMLEEHERTGSVDIAAWLERIPSSSADAREELVDFAFWVEQTLQTAEAKQEAWVDEGGVARRALAKLHSRLPRRPAAAAAAAVEKHLDELATATREAVERLASLVHREENLASERRFVLSEIQRLIATQKPLAAGASEGLQSAAERRFSATAGLLADTILRGPPPAAPEYAVSEEAYLRYALARHRQAVVARLGTLSPDEATASQAAVLAWTSDLLAQRRDLHDWRAADIGAVLWSGLGLAFAKPTWGPEFELESWAVRHSWFDVSGSRVRRGSRFAQALAHARRALGEPALAERFVAYLTHLDQAEVRACAAVLRWPEPAHVLESAAPTVTAESEGTGKELETVLAAYGLARVRERLARLGLLEDEGHRGEVPAPHADDG